MQVMMPSPAPGADLNFDSTSTSPFVSAPATPHRFNNLFYSAPTSPTASSNNSFFVNSDDDVAPPSQVPFNWEETPGVAKNHTEFTEDHNEENGVEAEDDDGATVYTELDDYDFEFDFSGQLETQSLTADELFDDGKIKPLKPPPRLFYGTNGRLVGEYSNSPKHSPHRSPKRVFREANLSFKEALSPKHRRKDFDPFSEAVKQTRKRSDHDLSLELRGRERISTPIRHKATRSLSPYRVSNMLFDGELNSQQNSKESSSTWLKLRDLLLFRSASEGSATARKDSSMKKYAVLNRKNYMSEEVKNSSFRSTDSTTSSGSTSRRRRRVSAHEMHYTANRAVTEEMRRKTFLPYRRGLLGCLGFTTHVQGVHREISRGFGSVLRRD